MVISIHDCDFNEFTFGHDVLRAFDYYRIGGFAPIIPHLRDEGKGTTQSRMHTITPLSHQPLKVPDGVFNASRVIAGASQPPPNQSLPLSGSDAVIQLSAWFRPIFLQFKIPTWVDGKNRKVLEYVRVPLPWHDFYRMPLRCKGNPSQHSIMCNMQNRGHFSLYVTPNFHEKEKREEFYNSRTTVENCSFIRPLSIGQLYDGKSHHISYTGSSTTFWRFSEPVEIENGIFSIDSIEKDIANQPYYEFTPAKVNGIANSLSSLAREWGDDTEILHRTDTITDAIKNLSLVSSLKFNCQLLLGVTTQETV